jgi:apolipoprotein N-acyltransferase
MFHVARLRTLAAPLSAGASVTRAGAAVASGLLSWAAAPGLELWPLAFVCWAPLLVALHGASPRAAFWLGTLQGLTFNLGIGAWLVHTLRTFGGYSTLTCATLMALICAYHGMRNGVLAWLHARAVRRGWPAGLVFGLALAASETAYPVLFPWYSAAQVHSVPVLMQLAELGGPVLVSLALAGGSVALAELGWARCDHRAVELRRLGLASLGPLLLLAYGLWRMPAIEAELPGSPELSVGIVQANLPHGTRRPEAAAALHRAESIALAAARQPDLIVWPETAIKAILPEHQLDEQLRGAVFGHEAGPAPRTAVLTGVIVRREADGSSGARHFNAAALLDEEGTLRGSYYKNVLFPMGEYIPFGDVFPRLYQWLPNAGNLTAGTASEPMLFRGHRLAVFICYEDVLPSFANRAIVRGSPELLVTLTNDVWFGHTTEPALHLALAKFRAVEHRRYLVRATNSGPSSIVDPLGRSLEEAPLLERATRVGVVRLLKASTPYEVLGEGPWWVATLLMLTIAWRRRPLT